MSSSLRRRSAKSLALWIATAAWPAMALARRSCWREYSRERFWSTTSSTPTDCPRWTSGIDEEAAVALAPEVGDLGRVRLWVVDVDDRRGLLVEDAARERVVAQPIGAGVRQPAPAWSYSARVTTPPASPVEL